MVPNMSITTPLERRRKQLGMTVEQVANSIGCSAPNYWRIESGKQQPRKDLLKTIILFFNDEVSEMEVLFPEQFADATDFDDLSNVQEG